MLQMFTITAVFTFPLFFFPYSETDLCLLALTIRRRKKNKIFIIFSLSSLWWLLVREMKAWKNHPWIFHNGLDFNRKWHRYSLVTWKLSCKRFEALKKISPCSSWLVLCDRLSTVFKIIYTCVSGQHIP